VRPIKGQMLALMMPTGAPLVRHVVWGRQCYLVPRADGRLLVGATVEERGFDTTITAGGLLGLLDDAWRTLPGIEDLPSTSLGGLPPRLAATTADAGRDRHRRAAGRDRPSPQRHPADAGDGRRDGRLILTGGPPPIRPFGIDRFTRSPGHDRNHPGERRRPAADESVRGLLAARHRPDARGVAVAHQWRGRAARRWAAATLAAGDRVEVDPRHAGRLRGWKT
jgi:hypothetical protein